MAEKDGIPNINSVRVYAIIDEAKTRLEAACPGIVSCADIVALASRSAVNAVCSISTDYVVVALQLIYMFQNLQKFMYSDTRSRLFTHLSENFRFSPVKC